jgi:predicted DsbA family dithiol-disulfide isomerase
LRVERDVESAEESGVAGTPTFFINGRRHYGAYDLDSLTEAFHAAQHRDAHGGHITRGLDVVKDLAAPSSRSS